jgi:hypothetical protein
MPVGWCGRYDLHLDPLYNRPRPAYVDILVASQFAVAAILISTISLSASWTTLWYLHPVSCSIHTVVDDLWY